MNNIDDLTLDLALGRGSETLYRRNPGLFLVGELADEADGVEIVGAEIVPLFGQAMSLVKNPGADLALADEADKRLVAQLLG